MQSLFDVSTYENILNRVDNLNEDSEPQWGKMQYKHLGHLLTQFGL